MVRSNRRRDVIEPNCRYTYEILSRTSLSLLFPFLSLPLCFLPRSVSLLTAPLPLADPPFSFVSSFPRVLFTRSLLSSSRLPVLLPIYIRLLSFSSSPSPSLVGLLVWPALSQLHRRHPCLSTWLIRSLSCCLVCLSSRRHLVLLVLLVPEYSSGLPRVHDPSTRRGVSYIPLLSLSFYRYPLTRVPFSHFLSSKILVDSSRGGCVSFASGSPHRLVFLTFFTVSSDAPISDSSVRHDVRRDVRCSKLSSSLSMAVASLAGACRRLESERSKERGSIKSNSSFFPAGRSRLYRSPADEIVRKRFAAVVAATVTATATATAIATATANVVATTERE